VVRSDGADDPRMARLPWLAGRGTLAGAPTAYACSVGGCRRPVLAPDELLRELRALGPDGDAEG